MDKAERRANTPEARAAAIAAGEAKRRIRRTKAEERIMVSRARPAHDLLTDARAAGVVVLKGTDASPEYFLKGLAANYQEKPGVSPVLPLDAQGTIQGPDRGYEHAQKILEEISLHRRVYGPQGAIAFLGFNFQGDTSVGTPDIHERLKQVVSGQVRRSARHDSHQAILLVGAGDVVDLPTHPGFHERQRLGSDIGQLVLPRLALGHNNELLSESPLAIGEADLRGLLSQYVEPVSRLIQRHGAGPA